MARTAERFFLPFLFLLFVGYGAAGRAKDTNLDLKAIEKLNTESIIAGLFWSHNADPNGIGFSIVPVVSTPGIGQPRLMILETATERGRQLYELAQHPADLTLQSITDKSLLDEIASEMAIRLRQAGITHQIKGQIPEPSLDSLVALDINGFNIVSHKYHVSQVGMAVSKHDIILIANSSVKNTRAIAKTLKRAGLDHNLLANKLRKIMANASEPESAKQDLPALSQRLASMDNQLLQNRIDRSSVVVFQKQPLVPIGNLDSRIAVISLDKYFIESISNYSRADIYPSESSFLQSDFSYGWVITDEELMAPSRIKLLAGNIILCKTGAKPKLVEDGNTAVIWKHELPKEAKSVFSQIIFGGLSASGMIAGLGGENTSDLGRLNYDIPESVGMSSLALVQIDSVINSAIELKAAPGCQVLVVRKGSIIFNKAYGYYTYDSLQDVNTNTLFDIASLTKVVATLQAIMFIEERGLIDLDKKAAVYLPELATTNKKDIILRDLLTHQAGLLKWIPLWQYTFTDDMLDPKYYDENFGELIGPHLRTTEVLEDSVWSWIKQSKLTEKRYEHKPYQYAYSDLGFIMLQKVAESILNQPLEDFMSQHFYNPMGMDFTTFNPLQKFKRNEIAPTEFDNYFRYGLIQGYVHDANAAIQGGVSGHAGLFSNANDLAKLMQMLLQNGYYGGQRYLLESTNDRFSKQQYASNRRGLGWDRPAPDSEPSPTSDLVSNSTFGHTGFTGTAVWADPEHELIYVFLSNRIYPNAENDKLIRENIRSKVQDIIYSAIITEKTD